MKTKITKVIYQNSSDDTECLRIKFENVQKVLSELETIANNHAIEFAEWLFCQDISLYGKGMYINDKSEILTIAQLLEIYLTENN